MADEENYDDEPEAGEAGGEDEEPEEGEEPERDPEENEDEEKEAEEEQEVEEPIPPNPLTEDIIAESLSLLCKTGDGLSHAYVRLDIHERGVTDIAILQSFIHLRYVDVSKNSLKDISPLSALTHMLTLKADENLLLSPQLEEMPFLQVASFSHNKINTTEGVNHPMLEHLILNNNNIKQVTGLDPEKLARLHTLELRGNKLDTTDGIYLPNVKNLFLAANVIKRIEGLSRCATLTTVHLRDNQLENLDGFSEELKNLQYINLRGNLITSVKEAGKLQVLPTLRALSMAENPVAEEDDYRLETLIGLRTLERLDKDEYTEEERHEAEEIYEQRKMEAEAAEAAAKEEAERLEAERIAQEEADRLAAEEDERIAAEEAERKMLEEAERLARGEEEGEEGGEEGSVVREGTESGQDPEEGEQTPVADPASEAELPPDN